GMVAYHGATPHFGKEVAEGVVVMGASPNVASILSLEIVDGRYVTDIENRRGLNVVFIGHDIKQKFFPSGSSLRRTISIEGLPFEVVGVAKAQGSVFGQSQDNFVIIPVESYFKIWGSRGGMDYAGLAIDHAHLIQAEEETRMLLRVYRHLGP